MKIKILSPLWGHENLPLIQFLDKVRHAGFDGIETWLPAETADRFLLFDYLDKHQMYLVTHQYQAAGNSFKDIKKSFLKNLHDCATPNPILINSHTGRDYFTFNENLELVAAAQEFSAKTGVQVAHETHRGRLGYSPQLAMQLFNICPDMRITADFSHWVCVTESMLENFPAELDAAIRRSSHIHARVGFEQGPQIPDPQAPEWSYAVTRFMQWWERIININYSSGTAIMPITTEFGPEPYMPKIPYSKSPMVDQFQVNCYMKDLLASHFKAYI